MLSFHRLIALFVLVYVCSCVSISRHQNFYIDWQNDRFVKDGLSWSYRAGGVHYFRSHPQDWARAISSAKSAGLNAIQSYIAWGLHEPRQGEFNFDNNLDLLRFMEAVQEEDMALILRVGPYICGEMSFGGLPPWLLANPHIKVRSMDVDFLTATQKWLALLLEKIKPYLYNNGGPVIMIQVENEYGAYGCDDLYLGTLYHMFYEVLGEEVVYFTTDGPGDYWCGSLNDTRVLTTIDYLDDNDEGLHTDQYFEDLRVYQPRGPLVNSEYYTGWLDKWGSPHSTRSAVTLAKGLDKLLGLGASFALFMWHGGSNTGLAGWDYTATTTYDYDAPLSEDGSLKLEKYWSIRNTISSYHPDTLSPVPGPRPKMGPRRAGVEKVGHLVDEVGEHSFIVANRYPLKLEEMGVLEEGMIAYVHHFEEPLYGVQLTIEGVHDRAYVMTDDHFVKVLKREEEQSFTVSIRRTLTILLESMGYMAWLADGVGQYSNLYKGISRVLVNGHLVEYWSHYKIPLDKTVVEEAVKSGQHVDNVVQSGNFTTSFVGSRKLLQNGPSIYTGTFDLLECEVLDTFFNSTCWGKGVLVVNGVVIGRYWPDAGPQITLYVPKHYLKAGLNKITLLELQSECPGLEVQFTDHHVLDGPVDGRLVDG